MSKIRIGRITYSNIWPISHFFDEAKFVNEVELIPQVPSQLNKQMANGAIDIGPISSFSYAEHADDYILLPNLSVSAHGKVGSISLFLKSDISDIANKMVALTNTSATSVNLLRIILEWFVGGKPKYISMEPNLEKMMEVADAALLIGDDALLANMDNRVHNKYQLIDLGSEWLKRTNKWMTFAVWAVRREIIEKEPELLFRIYQEFVNSKKMGRSNLHVIIEESISRFGGSKEFWENYYKGLTHDFSEEQMEGLSYYYHLANKLGFLEKKSQIEVIDFSKLKITNRIV